MDRLFPAACLFAALLTGCAQHTPKQAAPPLRVGVAEAAVDSVPNRMSFIGYLASNFDAVIQPRVNGYLSSKQYGNGMPVRRGQLLFTIDPDQLSTSMLAAEAELESARAQALEARNNYDRAVPLARIDAIGQSQLDQYTAQWKAAEASVRSAEQSLRNARMNVGYTELRSPIDGIIEHTAAHVGDYVGPGTQFSVLTTVSNIDTLTVDVAIPMSQYLRYAGRPDFDLRQRRAAVGHPSRAGRRLAIPATEESTTTRARMSRRPPGTLVVVVMFPNPDETLKPGQFARVEASVGPVRPRVVVPQQAVSQTQDIASVWVVEADSTVHYRRVTPGDTYGAMWCIDEGLDRGERVVVAGQQKLHDGAKVIPENPTARRTEQAAAAEQAGKRLEKR